MDRDDTGDVRPGTTFRRRIHREAEEDTGCLFEEDCTTGGGCSTGGGREEVEGGDVTVMTPLQYAAVYIITFHGC